MMRQIVFRRLLVVAFLAAPAVELNGQPAERPPRSEYQLGPGDQIAIHALDAEELSDKPVRIDENGNISLPLVGELRAAGLTAPRLAAELTARLGTQIKAPHVSVTITEFRSQPVSVIGAVNNAGVHQLQGRKTLVEMLSLAGGLRQDAGYRVKITRELDWGEIPIENARVDSSGKFSVAEVSLKDILEANTPGGNIRIMPHDVISVPRAQLVYVIGEVHKSGGFVLGERETVSVLQALSMAEGLARTAAPGSAKILRSPSGDSQRIEIAVDLRRILSGKDNDVPLRSDDILFVPTSKSKNAVMRSLEAAIQLGTGFAIYRR
jgi:polysaccharide export outer membrane protein